MRRISGIPISRGVAIGRLRIWRQAALALTVHSPLTPGQEWQRFLRARQIALSYLATLVQKAMAQAGPDSAAIFSIHQMLLEDQDYTQAVRETIDSQGVTAEYAVSATGQRFSALFTAMADPYMRAREADIRDISRRLVQVLTRIQETPFPTGEPLVLAADDLSPSETMLLDTGSIQGFITRYGSPTSHTAILARAMGLPALVRVDFPPNCDGKPAVLDGDAGILYVDPTPQLPDRMEGRGRG